MQENSQLGLITELHCQLDFTKYGFLLSQPIINDSRYDYVVEINHQFYRIQCKTSVSIDNDNAFMFPVSNKNWNNGIRKDYHGEIDYFYTYFNGQGYLIPIDKVGKKTKILRLNSQIPNPAISWAEDYEIEKILKSLSNTNIIDIEEVRKNKTNEKIKDNENNHCIDCGQPISAKAKRCRSCNSKYCAEIGLYKSSNIKYPSREELKDLIRTKPFVQIGLLYGISDNAIRKWCKKNNLPSRKIEINAYSDEEWSAL